MNSLLTPNDLAEPIREVEANESLYNWDTQQRFYKSGVDVRNYDTYLGADTGIRTTSGTFEITDDEATD